MNRSPILRRVVVFMLIPFVTLCLCSYIYLLRSLPASDNFTLIGKGYSRVAVTRDSQGVAYLSSDDDNSIFYAMGYVQAQDRLWQLTLQQRIVQGRLSEMLGQPGLKSDTFIRTLGIYRAAQQAWLKLDRAAKDSLTAYAAGVNQAIRQQRTLPPEFLMLGVQPENWTPIDSLAWVKMFALDLGGNMLKEIQFDASQEALTPQQVRLLFPAYLSAASPPDADDPTSTQITAMKRSGIGQSFPWFGTGGAGVGSNAWVVSGRHTQSGYPLLSNDPHLRLQQPSPWFAVSQRGANLHAQGMSLVGTPLIIFGSNEHIAWGGTALTADVQDLYIETVNPDRPSLYKADGRWLPFTQRTEEIRVRSGIPDLLYPPLKNVRLNIKETRHGPVVSRLFPDMRQTLSLKWTALDPNDTSYMAFMSINYAQDWSSFQSAARLLVAPALNLLYADTQNHIGMLSAGAIPVRGRGQGELPLPGDDSRNDWQGYILFDELPIKKDPDSGFIVSANNEVSNPAYPHFISHDWAPPTRKERISELLREKIASSGDKLTRADMKVIQADTFDKNILAFRDAVVEKTSVQNARQASALKILAQWDGDMRSKSVAASLIISWSRYLRMNMVTDLLPKVWGENDKNAMLTNLATYIPLPSLVDIITRDDGRCQVFGHRPSWDSCQVVLSKSLGQALDELGRMRGNNMDNWQWGDLHYSYYAHSLFSQVRFLDRIFSSRISNGGSPDSVNVSDMNFDLSQGYSQQLGASFRMIIELSPAQPRVEYINSTGQSGNILSKHYRDMVKPFNTFYYFEINNDFNNNSLKKGN
ncbi:Peptidase S45 penicillin amidase [Xenorhabdus bovienii str. kraussei Becker Underwood]|uniref:Peptidase S45 penicillin amidase n=2 Tax=Xenorhabdus bovienii TaxID=40576 RepID=A0A077Q033_XENBV|nr:Peptidase S45 penicillin amidase [Xenorhabdus bovienii str. kraussei Becker Underwood]